MTAAAKTINVAMVEAGQRQLDEAIRLFFEKRDPVSIHTLTAAAHGVLLTACQKEKRGYSIAKDERIIRPKKESFG